MNALAGHLFHLIIAAIIFVVGIKTITAKEDDTFWKIADDVTGLFLIVVAFYYLGL